MFRKKFASTTVALGLLAFIMLTSTISVKAVEPHAPDSIWIDPSSYSFDTSSASVGSKFNVTMWTNISVSSFTWQVKVTFNTTHIQAVRADYSGVGKSIFFTGHSTVPVSPQIDNVTGSVLFGESLVGADTRAAGSGSLMWVEFQIMTAPTSGNLTSTISIANVDTYMLDPDLNTVTTTKGNATYTYTYTVVTDTTPPTVNDPIQVPDKDHVDINQNVTVSTNVTDNVGGSGIQNVTIKYHTIGSLWTDIPMTLNATTGNWTGIIPGYINGTEVEYQIDAFDNAGNPKTNDNGGNWYYYKVIPEFTPLMLVMILMVLTVAVVAVRKKLTH